MSDCLFCGVIDGKIKANVVYQNERIVAFKDIGPKAPVHILIIPRKHLVSVLDIEADDSALIGGFRVVVNSGADAGQSVFHLHYHLLGGRQMGWPPG